ncbi:MAG: lipoprotein-releasing ABC transporter permease subunit [Gammaproteobacteria bacterium]|nr:MAG: lipoprotein-releasing ABC transporter permease subunit [Gammaproteobacteria bacterium]
MIRPLELFIGLRYTRAKRRNHFISFISLTSMLGIVLGVMALITVLSVMNGFGKELRDRILGVVSHVTITQGNNRLANWQGVATTLGKHESVLATAPYISGQGMLSRGKQVSGVVVRGIVPKYEKTVSHLADKVTSGSLDDLRPGKFGIIIGNELAWKLNVSKGAQISLIIPQALATPAGMLPRFKRFTVIGVFEVGMYEYDSGLALIHIQDAARLYGMAGAVSGLRLRLDDLFAAPRVAAELEEILDSGYFARDWTQEHANFFRALKIEKRVMLIILLLIVAVAAFNIVSTLVMVVTDKQNDIAILRTLGLSPAGVMGVFMVQGTVIGVVGTLLGVISGVLLALNVEEVVHFIEGILQTTFLAADVYYITDLPADIHWQDVTVIALASLVMGMFATIYPAWRASRVQPAEALRFE